MKETLHSEIAAAKACKNELLDEIYEWRRPLSEAVLSEGLLLPLSWVNPSLIPPYLSRILHTEISTPPLAEPPQSFTAEPPPTRARQWWGVYGGCYTFDPD